MIDLDRIDRNEITWQNLCLLYEEEFRILNRRISSLEKNMEINIFHIERLEQENKNLERRINESEGK
jgi:hypothetical protein